MLIFLDQIPTTLFMFATEHKDVTVNVSRIDHTALRDIVTHEKIANCYVSESNFHWVKSLFPKLDALYTTHTYHYQPDDTIVILTDDGYKSVYLLLQQSFLTERAEFTLTAKS